MSSAGYCKCKSCGEEWTVPPRYRGTPHLNLEEFLTNSPGKPKRYDLCANCIDKEELVENKEL